MSAHQYYPQLLESLKRGERPALKLSQEELLALQNELLESSPQVDLTPTLCLLHHADLTANSLPQLDQILGQRLAKHAQQEKEHHLIFMLNLLQKQVIPLKKREGEKLNRELLKQLTPLLHHRDLEVVEWTLRTLHLMGSDAKNYLLEVKKICPILPLFNQRKKTIKILAKGLIHQFQVRKQK